MFNLIKNAIRRSPFAGQLRIFHYLFRKKYLKDDYRIAAPLTGNFLIRVNTQNLIDARVVYTGDYEPEIKQVFKAVIKKGDIVLDIGANIGFHSLYFSELTGIEGTVIAFEPIPVNFKALQSNLQLNRTNNVVTKNFALSDKNEVINIHVDQSDSNPGAFNLFSTENSNTEIKCMVGDEAIGDLKLQAVNFIKIDVEGYEHFVITGLAGTIQKYKPTIVFEYDRNYQLKVGLDVFSIFKLLENFRYKFYIIGSHGLADFTYQQSITSANILALPVLS